MEKLTLSVRKLNDEELSKIDRDDIDFPQIAIVLRSNDGKEFPIEYMYPLRGYTFQIGGLNANGATVQGWVIGIGNVIRAMENYVSPSGRGAFASNCGTESTILTLVNGMASSVMLELVYKISGEYYKQGLARRFVEDGFPEKFILDFEEQVGSLNTTWVHNNVWREFIEYTIKYFRAKIAKDGY